MGREWSKESHRKKECRYFLWVKLNKNEIVTIFMFNICSQISWKNLFHFISSLLFRLTVIAYHMLGNTKYALIFSSLLHNFKFYNLNKNKKFIKNLIFLQLIQVKFQDNCFSVELINAASKNEQEHKKHQLREILEVVTPKKYPQRQGKKVI